MKVLLVFRPIASLVVGASEWFLEQRSEEVSHVVIIVRFLILTHLHFGNRRFVLACKIDDENEENLELGGPAI